MTTTAPTVANPLIVALNDYLAYTRNFWLNKANANYANNERKLADIERLTNYVVKEVYRANDEDKALLVRGMLRYLVPLKPDVKYVAYYTEAHKLFVKINQLLATPQPLCK